MVKMKRMTARKIIQWIREDSFEKDARALDIWYTDDAQQYANVLISSPNHVYYRLELVLRGGYIYEVGQYLLKDYGRTLEQDLPELFLEIGKETR